MKKILHITLAVASLTVATALHGDAFLYEDFSNGTVPNALANGNTSDGNGSYSEFTNNADPAEGIYANGGNLWFSTNINPFGTLPASGIPGGNNNVLQQQSGFDTNINFLNNPLTAGDSLYFSFNVSVADLSAEGSTGVHNIFFRNDTGGLGSVHVRIGRNDDGEVGTDPASYYFEVESNSSTTDRSSLSLVEDGEYFVYGRVDTNAGLTAQTISASIVDDINNISLSETFEVSASRSYASARGGVISDMQFDTAGSGAPRTTFDEIRLGLTYADVTNVPEPSSYALISGALALGWIMVRRRR